MAAVCVFCASSEEIAPRWLQLAEAVGAGLAQAGHSLVSGGGSISMMGAVAAAARAGGAHTTGVIPRALADREVADLAADELLVTDGMRDRKAAMDARSDAFLALPGGLGTLEEVLEIWVAGTLAMHRKPLVILDPDGLFEPLRQQVALLTDRGFVRASAAGFPRWVATVEQALAAIASGLRPEDTSAGEGLAPSPAEVIEGD
jgi:uncharacterized protein (TIGR00730 family)